LAASVAVFTHELPHTVSVAAHVTQLPVMQTAPATHWLADVQLVTHEVAPQMNGLHGCVVDVEHAPAPLHPAMPICMPLAQLGWRQTTLLPGNTHAALLPPQLALQGEVPVHCGWPIRGVPVT
jgi:hypothetical protein